MGISVESFCMGIDGEARGRKAASGEKFMADNVQWCTVERHLKDAKIVEREESRYNAEHAPPCTKILATFSHASVSSSATR